MPLKSLNLKLLCRHPAHNFSEGCGNPECWKYQADAYDKFGGEGELGLTREEYEVWEDPATQGPAK